MLPIHHALPELKEALRGCSSGVLVAPPGAGKTTVVPLELLGEPWAGEGKIVVLEPRRLAARAAARRMAQTLDDPVGGTVGFRVRMQSKVSARTRIEVVTEGVFTRMILDDPGLEGVSAVLFDEFHERSLDADLGLALARATPRACCGRTCACWSCPPRWTAPASPASSAERPWWKARGGPSPWTPATRHATRRCASRTRWFV
jgi:HrpA-like RNA helicase